MLWMYLTGMAILVGGALNSVLSEISEEDSKNAKGRLRAMICFFPSAGNANIRKA
jgi:uncharacterized BrkB/YihY/UPF0761 family membrane protein